MGEGSHRQQEIAVRTSDLGTVERGDRSQDKRAENKVNGSCKTDGNGGEGQMLTLLSCVDARGRFQERCSSSQLETLLPERVK